MRIKLYLDEDIPAPLSHALRQRDIDILTTQEAGKLGASDPEQIRFASEKGRAFLTHNKRDFIILHKAYIEEGKTHSGIIVADPKESEFSRYSDFRLRYRFIRDLPSGG